MLITHVVKYFNEHAAELIVAQNNQEIHKVVEILKEQKYSKIDIDRAILSKNVFNNKTANAEQLYNLAVEFLQDKKNKN